MEQFTKVPHYRGYWKFKDSYVSREQLAELASEWAQDERYKTLIIRRTSSDQHGIGFEYQPEDNSEGTNNKYTEELSDELKKRFGNGLAGWDIANKYYQIK